MMMMMMMMMMVILGQLKGIMATLIVTSNLRMPIHFKMEKTIAKVGNLSLTCFCEHFKLKIAMKSCTIQIYLQF